MGSLHHLLLPTFSLWAVTVVLLVSPVVHSLMTCSTIKLPTKRHYSDCLELPTLDSYLHWTYNRTNLTLSLAFTAPQPKPEGWVAWALNPTSNGMVGAQALVGIKRSNGSVSAGTYKISSYSSVVPSKLSFEVWDLSAQYAHGNVTIFATVNPVKTGDINHVWQVGPGIDKATGQLMKHESEQANLASTARLDFEKSTSTTSTNDKGITPMVSSGNGLSLSKLWLVSLLGVVVNLHAF